jgi:chloramphenicol 3-O phosphotransferase
MTRPEPALVVVLNGVGSAGKGSIAKALQGIARRPLLHVAMDAFLDMLPERLFDRPDGLVFRPRDQAGPPVVDIHVGPVAERCFRGMRHAIAALAAQGNDMIVDEVMTAAEWTEYRALLTPYRAVTVGVMAPLEILEQRERARGDRLIGLARGQFDRLHQGIAYDLVVDTSRATAVDCARRIRDAFDL